MKHPTTLVYDGSYGALEDGDQLVTIVVKGRDIILAYRGQVTNDDLFQTAERLYMETYDAY